MTIKQQGGVFGRNPTFNNVDVEGTLTVNGEPISDFGTMAQQDADSVNIDGGAVDGVTLGTNSPVTEAQVDNLNINGNTISSTNADGSIILDANGTGIVDAKDRVRAQIQSGATNNTQPDAITVSNITTGAHAAGLGSSLRFEYANSGGGYAGPRIAAESLADPFGADLVFYGRYYGDVEGPRVKAITGNLAFPSGKGIDFSATSGTGTSELFDDYEEGTWTPTYAPSTGSFTSITYGNTGGVYTKIGNICIVSGYISTSALDTTGGSGAIKVGGLPYGIAGSSGGTRDAWRGGSIGYSAGWSGERPSSVFASGGASDFRIMYRSNATSDSSYVLVADMDTSGSNEIAFTLTYRV